MVQDEVRVSQDDHQQVVEVVSDPPGQHAQALQLLGAAHLRLDGLAFLLGLHALGYVEHHADEAVRLAALVPDRLVARLGRAAREIREVGELLAGEGTVQVGADPLSALDPRKQFRNRTPDDVLRIDPSHFESPPLAERCDAVAIECEEHQRRVPHHGAQAIDRDAQFLLGALSLGDIDHDATEADRPPVLAGHIADVAAPDGPAVRRDQTIFECVVASLGGLAATKRDRPVAVVGM